MREYTVGELAQRMGATLLCGDPQRRVSAFSFSSKEGGEDTVFLPTVGERVDAHNFIGDAYANGMSVTLTERGEIVDGTEQMCYLAVEKTLDAWQMLGASLRKEHEDIPMVSITGSVGKTTTKELVATALTPGGEVLKTVGNQNGQLGVPRMMQMLDDEPALAVIEMGMSLFGEMARIAAVAMPNYAIITNIGVSHIGNLHSKENIRKEKLCIINRMRKPGIVLVNGDDPLLAVLCPSAPDFAGYDEIALYEETRAALDGVTVLAYGQADWCDYRCEDVVLGEESVGFTFCHEERCIPVELPVPGIHNVSNAVAALAVAHLLGLDVKASAEALRAYRPMAMRGMLEKLGGELCLIDDTYNASPDSMRSGLDILAGVEAKRRIAVLADILELGEQSAACHRLVGEYVAERPIDILVTVGPMAKEIAAGAIEKRDLTVHSFDTKEDAAEYILPLLKSGDAILLKGSRGMKLDVLAAAIRRLSEEA